MTDGPGSVSTLILVVVRGPEEGRGELLLPEGNRLAGLDIEDVPKCVVDKGEGDSEEDVGKVENEGTAEAGAATTRLTRLNMAKAHMNVWWLGPVNQLGGTGKGKNRRNELYRSVKCSMRIARRSILFFCTEVSK